MSDPSAKAMLGALRKVVQRAIWTMAALPDPESRFLVQTSGWDVLRASQEAYGYSAPRVRRFHPTAKDITTMEVVYEWLAWLRRQENEFAVRRIVGWAMAVPMWRLAQNEDVSVRTVHNRIDQSLNRILVQFAHLDAKVVPIDEKDEPVLAYRTEKSLAGHAGKRDQHQKVYIAGVGFMRGGEVIRDGTEKAERMRRRKKYA